RGIARAPDWQKWGALALPRTRSRSRAVPARLRTRSFAAAHTGKLVGERQRRPAQRRRIRAAGTDRHGARGAAQIRPRHARNRAGTVRCARRHLLFPERTETGRARAARAEALGEAGIAYGANESRSPLWAYASRDRKGIRR